MTQLAALTCLNQLHMPLAGGPDHDNNNIVED